jgi:ElaB/YqjD/DUF883 family membrane-anchored ribosome-binding protein
LSSRGGKACGSFSPGQHSGTFGPVISLQLVTAIRHRKDANGLADFNNLEQGVSNKMSEFETEVKKAEKELEQGLVPLANEDKFGAGADDEFLGDLKMQAQEYGQKIQDAASKARDFANEKFTQAGDKFKELQSKDPKEMLEDAKDYARQKPGHALLISAAVGLVVGLLLRGGRK